VMGAGVVTYGVVTVATGRVSDRVDNRILLTVPAFIAMATGYLVIAAVATLPVLLGAVGAVGGAVATVVRDRMPEESGAFPED
ncbi:MAG: hypothetical protein ACOCQM_04250, partial [Natronomonas sp.]